MKRKIHMKWRVGLLLLVMLLSAGTARAAMDLRLHAWDGKSDPSKDPVFEEVVEDDTYILRNQKCYPGMEFGIYYFPSSQSRQWYAGISERIIPGVPAELIKRDENNNSVNFKIEEEGNYDFVLYMDKDGNLSGLGIIGQMVVRKSGESPTGLRLDAKITSRYQGSRDRSWDMVDVGGGWYASFYNMKLGALDADLNDARDDRLAKVNLPEAEAGALILANPESFVILSHKLGNEYDSDALRYILKYREAGSDAEFRELELDVAPDGYVGDDRISFDFVSDYGIYIGYVTLPANTEYYLAAKQTDAAEDPTEMDIMPVSAEALHKDGITEWTVAPRAYGAPSEPVYFTTGEAFHGIVKFNPSTMDLRMETPTEGPWDIYAHSDFYPDKIYMHGIVPLEGNPIADWGGYHEELAARLDYSTSEPVYDFKLDLTGDAWFRLFTEEDKLTGLWSVLGSYDKYAEPVRGCWVPAANVNVDVPTSRHAQVNSWNKLTPEEGSFWRIPAGKWHLIVKLVGVGPNKPVLYCQKDEEVTDEYVIEVMMYINGVQKIVSAQMTQDENGNYTCSLDLPQSSQSQEKWTVNFSKYLGGTSANVSFVIPRPEDADPSGWDISWTDLPLSQEKEIALQDGSVDGFSPRIDGGTKGRYRFTYDPAAGTLKYTPDYSIVHMPLGPDDFTDMDGKPRPHYFLVGSRTADFRLMPEWELKPENNYAIENRLMYPGMFGIARVDTYDDYVLQRFKLWYVRGILSGSDTFDGLVVNKPGDYTLDIDYDEEWDDKTYTYISVLNPANAIKEYGDYYSTHGDYTNPWPFVVFRSMKNQEKPYQKVTSWWHFTDFGPDGDFNGWDLYERETLAKAFKKGTPSLASSIGITLDENGDPAKLLVGDVKTWKENKADVLREVNFFMVGTDFINERPYGDIRYFDPQRSALYGYTNVTDWANQWIQYDPESGQAYMDGDGKYLFQTVYQDSWIKGHPTLFYRASDNTVYDSNTLRLRSLAELAAAGDDKFEGYYRDMQDKKLGDGTLKKYTYADAPVKYDFYDRVGAPDPHVGMAYRKGDIEAPMAEGGWQPYALSDLTFGGWFKVWSGFGGGHEGYGSWTDHVEIGDAYAWFNMNVGHSMARNPLRVKAGEVEVNASESTPEAEAETDRLVNFYLTGKDDPAADFMTHEVDGAYPLRTYKRLILWLNTTDRTDLTDNSTSGMAKSYVQLVVSDLSPVIKARHGEVDHSVVYAWNLVKENMFDDKTVTAATVTVYRDGEVIGTYPQPEAVGKLTSECTAEGMFSQTLTDCLAGEYWMKVDVTYDDGVTKDAVSNHIHIYDEVYPALLTAWQRTATVGDRTLYGFNVSGTVGLPETDENRAFKEYTDGSGVKKRLYLKDLISHFLVSYKVPEADILTKRVEYVPGETTEFLLKLDGSDRVTVKAQAVAKESPLTVDGQTVELTANEISLLENTLATEAVELTLPIAKVNVTARSIDTEDFDTEADITAHPGHTDATPVRYRKVNSMNSTLEIEDNALLEAPEGEQETVSYTLAAANGRLSADADGTSARVTHADAFTTEDNLFRSENTYTLTTEYRRGDVLLKGVADKTVTADEWERELPRPARITVEDEDIALRGARKNWNGKYGMLCELRIFVPNSVNDGVSASDIVYLGGFDRPEGIDAAPVVKASEDLKGGFLLISDKHADEFMGLEGTTIGGSFLEWNGTQSWCENHDWAHAVAREGFALNFADAVFYEGQDFASYTDGVSSPAFTVKTYNVYPFLVESGSAEAKAPTRAASAADNLKLLSLDGLITVPEKNWNDRVFTGIGEAYGPTDGPVDVYTTTGQLVMRGVTRAEALRTLQSGLYLVGNEKIMVK